MKLRLIFTIVLLLVFTHIHSSIYAQSPTLKPTVSSVTETVSPTAEPTKKEDSTIQNLKEKIESKVAQINQNSKKIVKGIIKDISDKTLKITSSDNREYSVDIDTTITTFSSSNVNGLKDIKQSDLEKGQTILVTGPIIENQISANHVYLQTEYLVLQGQITAVDEDDFTVSIVTPAKDQYVLDIQKGTKQLLMNSKDLTLTKSGFSKFKVGDSIHAVIEKPKGSVTSEKANTIRTLIIPQEYFEK